MKKLVTYTLIVSTTFPSTHKRKGEKTMFVDGVLKAINCPDCDDNVMVKLHSIRGNYPLWVKRIKKILEGKAVLNICHWTKPGGRFTKGNELRVICQLDKDSGVGVQRLLFSEKRIINPIINEDSWYKGIYVDVLAKNDCLSLSDFKEWFKGYDLSKEMALIHFTKFRY